MVAYSGNENMIQTSSFFADYHGVQQLRYCPDQYTVADCEYDRLENFFKYADNFQTAQGLMYLKYLHDVVKQQVSSKIQDDIPLENIINDILIDLVKYYKENGVVNKQVFSRLPQSHIQKIEKALENLIDRLPNNFYTANNTRNLDTNQVVNSNLQETDPLFYIPLKEDFPEIDRFLEKPQKDNFSLLYIKPKETNQHVVNDNGYPLETMFQCYGQSITGYDYRDFKGIVHTELNSNKTNDEVMEYFLETFGYESFDFLTEIIKHRYEKIDYTSQLYEGENTRCNKKNPTEMIAGQVTVQSEKESLLSKKLRKLEKKDKTKFSSTELRQTEVEYDVAKNTPIFKKSSLQILDSEEYPHIHDQLRNHMITTKYEGMSIAQPDNAKKKITSDYVEFTIPGGKKGDVKDMELVEISSLDSIGQLVFRDINQFNRIQSEVFPVAYHSNENMLVCAPTGAGKTNIALLSIVHQVKCHMEGSLIRKNDFKIIYVCPMKALATEMVVNFSKKLAPIGITVKECTGDMQLSKKEIAETQMLVTTPEKWDVITRKGAVDTEVVGLVKLLIIDEVHLLNGSRGPVIEALVARTLRQVVSSQSMIRIVALSATLPGYMDVANFLKVNPRSGLFFFDNRFRSVPLTTSFIGCKKKNNNENEVMDMVCYEKVVSFVREGHQAMVFVTSRNATASVARKLIELAQEKNTLSLFEPEKNVRGLRNAYKSGDLAYLIPQGFGIHHAGMVRSDRLEVERLFRDGFLKVIICTTTLAWGVNLPAHAVIIRGTLHYDATKSTFVDMDMLDVQQIFGRAGRPQYDTSGHGIIITSMTNMSKYMGLMLSQVPIESQFLNCVPDNLNAEIVLGTVSNIKEAMEWLANTFLFVRIKKNPLVYGLTYNEIWDVKHFNLFLQGQLDAAANILEKSQLIRFDKTLGELRPTNFGRIASFYYISYRTMEMFYEKFDRHISESALLQLISEASEFAQIQVRLDEIHELDRLREYNMYDINLDFSSYVDKVIILIQANISRAPIRVSSLVSDTQFIMQTVTRLARALFEIAKDKDYALQVSNTLQLAQMLELQIWDDLHPLMQFKELAPHLNSQRARDCLNMPFWELCHMSERELEALFRNKYLANKVKHCCQVFPQVEVDFIVKPITEGVIRVKLLITPKFKWDNGIHGTVQHYYAWVEDPQNDSIYHMESFIVTKRMCTNEEVIELVLTVPLLKPLSLEYFIRVVNSQFLHSESIQTIVSEDLKLFTSESFQTKILDVQPLPKTVLKNKSYEDLYPFTHFNAVQSQVFHSCYYTNSPIILGAPTGSGKTIVAEMCILRLFQNEPQLKVVYIAPLKALVRERVVDWSTKFSKINKKVIEVTGDITPRSEFIRSANIIITTPEKWDAMSRNWTEKDFVKDVGLMVIDEIHLLGEDRGPVLEVIVSRMNYINMKTKKSIRIVGLSTAMANPGDLAYWLNADKRGIFNFSSAVRPVPLEIHLQGFNVKHFCPRMAAMNKPCYQAICQYANDSSALIFVASRKQTRITGYELMKLLLSEGNQQKWLRCHPDEIEEAKYRLVDQDLAQLLSFGIGIHHAALTDNDRNIVEHFYVNRKIQVLVATATLAWGVNFPARLVIVKGTEYFDGATKRYVDMPITDVIQMVGRAGRPQFDTMGIACVMVQENKKNFYRKFLFEPFPVESNLLEFLPDHVNAEIYNGNITNKAQLIEFIQSTFFYRRLLANPSYYQMDNNQTHDQFIDELATSVVGTLQQHECIVQEEGEMRLFYESTILGVLAAQYYLSYKTIYFLSENMSENSSIEEMLELICQVEEYKLIPVRHNEDNINRDLVRNIQLRTSFGYDSPALKVLLMIKYYLLDLNLPNQEYVLDLKNVLDQIIRIIHAMMNLAANRNWLNCTEKLIYFCQMLIQGYTIDAPNVLLLPYMNRDNFHELKTKLNAENLTIPGLRCSMSNDENFNFRLNDVLSGMFGRDSATEMMKILKDMPLLTVRTRIRNITDGVDIECDLEGGCYKVGVGAKRQCIFELNISRKGSSKMNVYSKKLNKQKEEFWFLIFVDGGNELTFRKFSFTKNFKKISIPVQVPERRGIYNYSVMIMSDCYIGLDQIINYKVKVENN
ncbi:activating signal cointegrator 1 complex subunit 3-like isoform X1 [Diorhabda sublineata]|uniref:activating signal cointegrator 1 complex subunit 3-like isoform X1 n=1 Tax=Diorhabda sublineata TaxID=1163346 RepID=UPI0024E175BB|nr:activating signal cointegrator 1 complex subunit 3-like isoform X1 [Diorhabda sublineata]